MTAQTTSQPLDHAFTAPIEKDGAFATYVTVPGSAELLGTRRAVKVSGTIDGHPFTATLSRPAMDRTGSPSERRSVRSSERAGSATR